eukprot:126566-Pelagomonas_calceolata.AAC.2
MHAASDLRRLFFSLQSEDDKCRTAHWHLMQAFQGLPNFENLEQAVRAGGAISINDFSADLRYRLQGVWREAEFVDPRGNDNKLATYQAWLLLLFHATLVKPTYTCLVSCDHSQLAHAIPAGMCAVRSGLPLTYDKAKKWTIPYRSGC